MRVLALTVLVWIFAGFAAAQEPTPTTAIPAPMPLTGETSEWDVCNETSFVLRFASAFIRSERMQTVGWTTVTPGACVAVETPKDSPRFLFAESLPIHRGGIRDWKGTVELCAKDGDFVSDSTDNCELNNFETRKYFAVDPAERNTVFIEPLDFGDTAEIAGLQRLLQDSGYNISRIDGLSGRRTLRLMADAKNDLKLDKDTSNQAFIEALIPVAAQSLQQVGLDICNDSSSRIFGALAVQENGIWTSRGWWPVDPGSCVKPYDQTLVGTQAHVYALQEVMDENGEALPDRRLRSETVTPSQFCIAESRFSALGNENCLDKGYAIANFRPIATDLDGKILRLTDADFTEAGEDGLRR